MRLRILSIGRAAPGPEADLAAAYIDRIGALSPRTRIGPAELACIDDKSNGGPPREAAQLLAAARGSDVIVTLDERGQTLTSAAFADALGRWRDDGVRSAAFLIGGADGHDAAARDAARLVLALSAMTWPHALVRAMVAEQLYRAATILAGHPYHRA